MIDINQKSLSITCLKEEWTMTYLLRFLPKDLTQIITSGMMKKEPMKRLDSVLGPTASTKMLGVPSWESREVK